MKKIFFVFALITAFSLCLPAWAAEVAGVEEYSLPSGETVSENLYVAAGNVVISGDVAADLIVGGGNILVSGDVAGDATLGGGSIQVLGAIGGDLRVVGGNVVIANNVAGDVVAAAGVVQILADVEIGGDVIAAGGTVMIDATVGGTIRAAGGEVSMGGSVAGDLFVRAEEKFKIGQGAMIEGRVEYSALQPVEISEQAEINGELVFNKIKDQGRPSGADAKGFPFKAILAILFALVMKSLLILVPGILGVLIFPKKSRELVERAYKNFGADLAIGLVTLIVVPIAALIVLITIIGVYVSVLAVILYVLLVAIAKVYAGIVLGALIYRLVFKIKKVEVSWKSALWGIIVMQAICFIPIIGWLFFFVFMLVALGSSAYLLYESFSKSR
ncbi:FapA family protein [Patescibacteria group bacterium]|nr:FapA family protein [Patescibacteria group bacterium]MBU1921727.1 FapA family protein [Patescibacteria group bacterium]